MGDRDPDFFKLYYRQWKRRMHKLRVPYDLQGALLAVVIETHLTGGPPADDDFVLAGVMMVSPRKARAVTNRLADQGLIQIKDGLVIDKTAVEDARERSELREKKVQAGREGGLRSGKVRRAQADQSDSSDNSASDNTLKNNEAGEAQPQGCFELEKSRVENTPHTPQGGSSANGHSRLRKPEIDAAFDRFWAAYPRHETKAKAREKLELILKRHEATADQLASAAASYARRMAAEGRPREKIAHPTTWLNQKRWEDEAEAQAQASAAQHSDVWRNLSEDERERYRRLAREKQMEREH